MSRESTSENQTGQLSRTAIYLIIAATGTVFSTMLIIVTCVLSWEMWMLPLIVIGTLSIWTLHLTKSVSGTVYEYLCAGILLLELFFYGVHRTSLFDLPVVVGIVLFVFSMLDKKPMLYLTAAVYILILLYHWLILRTIGTGMPALDIARLGLDVVGTTVTILLAGYLIDRRREEYKNLTELSSQLEQAKKQNSDFLSNISHELRTPINMVTGISEVTLEKQLPPDVRESLLSIQMAGRRLSGQINDILDYTEIEGNTLVPINDQYMISSVLNDAVTMTFLQSRNKALELILDMDAKLPSLLIGDGEKLCRVLKILLDNALKFTREGGIYVRASFRRESYGINLNIDIHDTGIGMQDSQLSHAGDHFYQADSGRSRTAGGLGLGLSIAQGLLRSMSGFLYCKSSERKGTQVHISIPQQVADDSPSMAVSSPEKFCVACYLRPDKYIREEIREYYNRMIRHIVTGLGIEAYQASRLEELERISQNHKLTHLFLAEEEYREQPSWFEGLGSHVCTVVIADAAFTLPPGSSLIVLCKPLSPLSIVNLLNGDTHSREMAGSLSAERAFTCEGVRALVVDDEEMNLVVAQGILNGYGMQVDTCCSGEEAIEQCMHITYDIIFLDHMMPGLDGVETLKRIRVMKNNLYQSLPIIALTANAISGAREMFHNEGFTEFVPKPIERPVLERALRRVLPKEQIHFKNRGTPQPPAGPECTKVPAPALAVPLPEKPPLSVQLRSAGIDAGTGLRYCSGSEDFYLEILQMYCSQYREKRDDIDLLYRGQNWEGYTIKVHALKSTSRTIGATELSELAQELEQAGKRKDISYISAHHARMLCLYDSVCGYLRNILSEEAQTTVSEKGGQTP